MRFKEFLQEAPLQSYSHSGDFDAQNKKRGAFNSTDRKLVKHPVHLEKMNKFFSKCPYDFVILLSNETKSILRGESHGLANKNEIKKIVEKFGLTTDEAKSLFDNPHAITCLFTGNDSDNPMTPWIHAHRIGHMYDDSRHGALADEFRGMLTDIVTNQFKLYDENGDEKDIGYVNEERAIDVLCHSIVSSRAARNGKLNSVSEGAMELFAQFILKGKIALNPIPKELKMHGYIGDKFEEFKIELDPRYRGEKLSKEIEDHMNKEIDSALKNMVGQVYIY